MLHKFKLNWLACLMALLVLGLAGPLVAQADEGYQVYDALNVSGYHMTVWATPNPVSVGKIHLLIRVGQASGIGGEMPVRGANVLVEFYPVSGPGADSSTSYVQRRNLVASESEPGTYELSDSLQNEGQYRIGLTVQVNGQTAASSFEVTAKPAPDDRLMSILLLLLFPLFLGWLVWMYLKNPGSDETRKEVTPAEPEPAQVQS